MINMSTEEGQIADRQLGEASQAMEDDGPVIEITEEQKFVDDGGHVDTKDLPLQSPSFVKQHLTPMKVMRQDVSHVNYKKSVLVYPVTLADFQDPTLLGYLEESQQFKINFHDRLKEHNTDGFLTLRFRTITQADNATERLKQWRDGVIVRNRLSYDCINKLLNEVREIDWAGEAQYMVFVRFLPDTVSEEALDQLIPGSISVDIPTHFKGGSRDYAYLTYKSPDEAKEAAEKYKDVEMDSKKLLIFVISAYYAYLTYKSPDEAKEAAEKYKDVEMDSKKLLVVHYGTYVEKPVKPEVVTKAMPDDDRIELIHQFHEMKAAYDQQLQVTEKKEMKTKLDALRFRLKRDAKLRTKENKVGLGIDSVLPKPALGIDSPLPKPGLGIDSVLPKPELGIDSPLPKPGLGVDSMLPKPGLGDSVIPKPELGIDGVTPSTLDVKVVPSDNGGIVMSGQPPPSSKQQRKLSRRKRKEMKQGMAPMGPNQLQGDGGPGAKGMLDTDMMNILPTAMNMLVGLLSTQLGQQQQQQQRPQQYQQQLQPMLQQHQQLQKQLLQPQGELSLLAQQKHQLQLLQQTHQQQLQQQKQQPQQQPQKPLTQQELKQKERNQLKLQKRRQWQKEKRKQKKQQLKQGLTGGAGGAAPFTSTGGVSPSYDGMVYKPSTSGQPPSNGNNTAGVGFQDTLYGTSGYYDNKPGDPHTGGFQENGGSVCQGGSAPFLDDDHNLGPSGFHSNTQWHQQLSSAGGGYSNFVGSSDTIGPGNSYTGSNITQGDNYCSATSYGQGNNPNYQDNSASSTYEMTRDNDLSDQGGWRKRGKRGRWRGNNKRNRID
ncbi:hypothetical protein LSAT2_018366 [Lamellibrachia satsuma]|nr:hypothetical protein LSAT2_018366 [Lamellibrachia satsuma]